jgi:hypothetical protein
VLQDQDENDSKKEAHMTHHSFSPECHDYYEYHGNTAIEHIRRQGRAVAREWLYFDSAEEAVEFFNDYCVN